MRPPRAVLVLLCALLAPLAAGCLQSQVVPSTTVVTETEAPPLHAVGKMLPVEVDAADGTLLAGHVYLPEGEGPFAVVLEHSPYWNTGYWASDDATAEVDGRTTLRGWLQPFMDAGFAVALVNMRGTGLSGGCMQWGGPVDWDDAARVVEWLGAQEWSNGNVGMFGISYPGWTQYMAMAAKPPALKAAIPMSGVIDPYTLMTRNGASITAGPILMPVWTAGTGVGAFALTGAFVPDTAAGHLACPRYAEDTRVSLDMGVQADRTPYFEARDLRPHIANTSVAVFATNGMDIYGEGHILQFEGLWDLLGPHKRLLVGQWPHDFPTGEREDFFEMSVAWFDQYLRGGPVTLPPGVVEYQDDAKEWHTTDRWPPAANVTTLHLSGTDLLLDAADVQPSQRRLVSADVDPAPGHCGAYMLAYATPPLAEDVRLAGNFRLDVTLSSTLPDGNFAALLYAVDGEGTCTQLDKREFARLTADLAHREGGVAKDFPLNAPTAVSWTSHPFATQVPKGSRILLALGGGSTELMPDARKPVLTVSTGEDLAGSIHLPVVAGTLRFG